MKNVKILLLSCFVLNLQIIGQAQDDQWNLVLDSEVDRFIGYQVYETDSFYYVAGTSVAGFGRVEQGFSVSKINKKDASVVATIHYEEPRVQYDFNNCRNGYLLDDAIIFPQTTLTSPPTVQLFKVNIHTLNIEKLVTIPPPDPNSKYSIFLHDFVQVKDNYYTALQYAVGERDTPNFKTGEFLMKYNIKTKETQNIFLPTIEKLTISRIKPYNNGLLVFAKIFSTTIGAGKMAVFILDLEGNIISQYITQSNSPLYDVQYLYPITDNEVLLASFDTFYSYTEHELYSRSTVTRYDVQKNKIIWSTFWNEPRKIFSTPTAKIIKAQKDGEFLLMANDVDSTFDGIGKVIKFNSDGKKLWQKTYDYTTNQGYNNFFNIIQTYEKNYLIVGRIFSVNLPQSPWLVKIDEDGNILPIDTTSTTTDHDVVNTIPEIKVYPNPASHAIIINQGEITDMSYQLIDMTGTVEKTIPLPHAHHHVVWDISDVGAGTYVLTMLHGGKLIGSRQQIIIR